MLQWVPLFQHRYFLESHKKPTLVNQVWFSDHQKLDLFVITGWHSDGSPMSQRVWITGIMDAATNAMVGYALSLHPNSSTIAEAFARACAFKVDCRYCGLPEYFYIDNGKDYNAKKLKGLPRSQEPPLLLNKAFAESGILEWFGIKVINALPYRGCSKTIERIWRTIKEQWISKLPGYCAGSTATRPVNLADDRKHGRLYTFAQFADYFADFIYPAYNSFSETNEAPDVLYDQLPKFNASIPTWRTLAVLKSCTQMRTVHRDGIHFQNRKYWCAALAPLIESATKVRIFAFDTPFNRNISVVMGSVYIGEAHLIDNLNLIEERRYRIIQHLQEQRLQFKTLSSHIKAIHSLMLQSDILDRTSDVPPIDHITYVQAIDADKDSGQAEDDPRIPDELKEKAIQYLDLTQEKPEQPGVASQFFQVLGERTNNEGMSAQ